jgi:hypothetical protein
MATRDDRSVDALRTDLWRTMHRRPYVTAMSGIHSLVMVAVVAPLVDCFAAVEDAMWMARDDHEPDGDARRAFGRNRGKLD